jgi:hypothetical protein
LSNSSKAKDPYEITKDQEELLVGTDLWRSVPINAYSPKTRGMWVEVHSPAYVPQKSSGTGNVDGQAAGVSEAEAAKEAAKWWPLGVKPWRLGAWMENAEVSIPAPVEWKL